MSKESILELRVGLFVLISLIGLTIFIFSINDAAVFEKGKTIKVIYSFANGLKKSAPVRIAGVDQGIVRQITLFFDRTDGRTKAEVELMVKRDARIPADSLIFINQLGLLGEKYIEITPGIDTKRYFEDGAVILGKDPLSQEYISEKLVSVTNKVDDIVTGLSRVMSDENNQKALGQTIQNMNALTGGLNDIVLHVKQGEGTVGRLFYDDRLYDDLQGLTADLKANPWKLLYRPKK